MAKSRQTLTHPVLIRVFTRKSDKRASSNSGAAFSSIAVVHAIGKSKRVDRVHHLTMNNNHEDDPDPVHVNTVTGSLHVSTIDAISPRSAFSRRIFRIPMLNVDDTGSAKGDRVP